MTALQKFIDQLPAWIIDFYDEEIKQVLEIEKQQIKIFTSNFNNDNTMNTQQRICTLLYGLQIITDIQAEYTAPDSCHTDINYFCEVYDQAPADMIKYIIEAAFKCALNDKLNFLIVLTNIVRNDGHTDKK